MSRRPIRTTLVLASFAALTLATPAFAASGSGGGGGGKGGGGSTNAAIQRASALATCDGGTTMVVTVDKGFDKRVEMNLSYSGMAAGKYFTSRMVNDATGLRINGFGSFPSSPSASVTNLGSAVTAGPVELTFTSTLNEGSFTGPVLETCTAHISTVAK